MSPIRLAAATDGDVADDEDEDEDEGPKARLCSKMRHRRRIRPEANVCCCGIPPIFSTIRAYGSTNFPRTMSVSVTTIVLPVSDCNLR